MLHQTPGARSAPPSSDTGGKIHSPPVGIDWLSFTVPGEAPDPENLGVVLSEWFGLPVAVEHCKGGLYGYTFSANVLVPIEGEATKVGCLAWGGESQRGRTFVSLPGAACALIASWRQVHDDLAGLNARLSRVDLAADDLDGVYSVDSAAEWYRAGDFNAGGRRPKHNTYGHWLDPDQGSRTLYIGKRENGKMLRVYEKGKQLGDLASRWVRWELQLGNKDRIIPLAVLTEPARYFAGGYAALERVVQVAAERIRTARATVAKSLDRLVTYARLSYGKLVNALLIENGGDLGSLAARLRARGLPRSLSGAWIAAQRAGALHSTA